MEKKIHVKTTIIVLGLTLLSILLAIRFLGTAIYGLLTGMIFTIFVSRRTGYSYKQIFQMMKGGAKKAAIVLIVMGLIGIIAALWMASGTIPAMMLYGFQYLTGVNVVLASFFITSMISMILGTAIGTMSTIGIPLLEIGKAIGVPPPIIVGAIVSGAYLGDRSSPMSSAVNLIAAITETKLIETVKHMFMTLIPVYVICTGIYYFLGKPYVMGRDEILHIQSIKDIILSHFTVGWFSLIPPLLILILAMFKIPIVYCMSVGILSSVFLMIFTQGIGFNSLLKISLFGYYPESYEVAALISGSGMISMKNVILIIAVSTALNGLFESTGMLEPLMNRFLYGIKSVGHLILKTSVLSFSISVLTCNQSLPIIITGRFMRSEYIKNNVSPETLARTIADTGNITVPLIPWNVNAVAITSILGIKTLSYLPYASLCYFLPVATLIFGYWGMVKRVERNYIPFKIGREEV